MSFEFNPLSEEFAADPYEVYARMRAMPQPHFFEDQGMVMLTRHADVDAVATHPSMVRSLDGLVSDEELADRQRRANWHDMPFHQRVVQFSLLDSDGETHRRLRKLVFGALTAQAVTALEESVQQYVDDLLDSLEAKTEFDFVKEFAAQIPGLVIGHLLGTPDEDCAQLRKWSEDIVRFFDVDRSGEKKVAAERSTAEFYHYLIDLKDQRKTDPRDDLISQMLGDEAHGAYSNDEFVSTCMLILMAGHGSSTDAMSSGLHLLLKRPRDLQTLRSDTDLLPRAIQEMFRFEPPLPFFHRHAVEDVTVGDIAYEKGTTFGLLYGAANRDPKAFDRPDTFDIARQPNRHLSFGRGAHLCLGNHLARMNFNIIFRTLLQRYRTIELVDPNVIYKPGLSVRGPKELLVSFQAQ